MSPQPAVEQRTPLGTVVSAMCTYLIPSDSGIAVASYNNYNKVLNIILLRYWTIHSE